MKKRLGILLVTVAVLSMAACGGKDENSQGTAGGTTPTVTTPEPTKAEEKVDANDVKGYVLEYNKVTIGVDMEAAPIIEALGEPDSYFEAASCAFEGLDKMYTYGSIEIDTYELDDKDYISAIIFNDDMISTKEGIALFMTKEEMITAYGENFTEELGMFVYEKDGMKLKFMLTDNAISYIEYSTTVLDAQ